MRLSAALHSQSRGRVQGVDGGCDQCQIEDRESCCKGLRRGGWVGGRGVRWLDRIGQRAGQSTTDRTKKGEEGRGRRKGKQRSERAMERMTGR